MRIDTATIGRMAEMLREMLGNDYDDATFLDTLDGETDFADIVDRVLAARMRDCALAEATKAQAQDLEARAKRLADRDIAHRKALKLLIDAAGLRKVERPLATVSVIKGRESVTYTDESAIPDAYTVTTKKPDGKAISEALKAGEVVPGAALTVGEESISVRVK